MWNVSILGIELMNLILSNRKLTECNRTDFENEINIEMALCVEDCPTLTVIII